VARYRGRLNSLAEYLKALGMMSIPFVCIMTQPDLGTGLVYLFIAGVALVMGGARPRYVLGTVGIIAVLVAAIDDFKSIEQKGREAAENAVRRVAAVLRGSFRSVDYVCRISPEEFVIIMTRVNSSMRKLIFDKVEQVNATLRLPDDGQPPVSLSVGVAFADRENPQGDILHDADTALYRMKEVRRCGCAVY
jgi:diguanylate cyclase (GGDEF)-like protein